MITPAFNLTATERVLPRLALDFTTASLDPRVTFTRATSATNPATFVNSSGIVTAATNNQPRFDYTLNTGGACKGLLIEESRVNICLQSEDLNTTWVKVSTAAVTPNAAVSPDGTQNADLLSLPGGGFQQLYQDISVTSGQTYTLSFYAKAANANNTPFRAYVEQVGGSATVITPTQSWVRYTVTATAPDGNVRTSFAVPSSGAAVEVYIWGVQLELGAFATSYIPTTLLPLTRNADVATMTGTNFSDWFNASEGTFEISATSNSTAAVSKSLLAVGTGTSFASGSYIFVNSANTNIGFRVYNSAVSTVGASDYTAVTPSPGTQIVAAMGYESDNFGFAVNAQTVATDMSGTLSGTATNLSLGLSLSGTTPANGHIQSLRYWPQRLINAEIQAISKG